MVAGAEVALGTVALRLVGPGEPAGLVGLRLRGARRLELDGLPVRPADGPPPAPAPVHPNGTRRLDHVVVTTPDLDRTVGALTTAGGLLRRRAALGVPGRARPMAFLRFGEVVVEVVEVPDAPTAPARGWGLAVLADVDRAAAVLGDALGTARPAVQPGRRIATVAASAGLSVPLAFISPRPPREDRPPAPPPRGPGAAPTAPAR